ncbi:N-acetylmuramic acid 6-phosphate etherase [Megasphaera paucivorans]|uniref:N-acetylmuramic acid 6-phosphate etherase n=1 Tax=Megasphaera paucivorans TaxID=349095 RepID=A0A1G9R2M4_9FIRM|nr:N-acetylmuramic acid 6-phosphate etherase [Megasphaera paucivorans]SDM17498.1 N-acetylmuramic acid 6-phosphate etherase [Megasphaera paucivorans]
MIELEKLYTEKSNPASEQIDTVSTLEMTRIINNEDKKVAQAIECILPQIAAAIDLTAPALRAGGRLFYIGAGTSGRLGILDAVECPPTYGTDPQTIQGLIAGGYNAMFRAKEGSEDAKELGEFDLKANNLTNSDVVIGLSASGRTPYVLGGLAYASSIGAVTISIDCSPNSSISHYAQIDLCALVGPEVITGSTRMKAGTAQKMILNMLSTGIMIKLGKVYGNLMVDVKSSNEKLKERALRIVMKAAGCNRETAIAALSKTNNNTKEAIIAAALDISKQEASSLLTACNGYVYLALQKKKRLHHD